MKQELDSILKELDMIGFPDNSHLASKPGFGELNIHQLDELIEAIPSSDADLRSYYLMRRKELYNEIRFECLKSFPEDEVDGVLMDLGIERS